MPRAMLALALVLAGCSAPKAITTDEAATRLVAPRHGLTGADGLPTGDLVAALAIRNGCLVLETAAGNVDLALWPPSAQFEVRDGSVTVLGAGAPAQIGDRIHVGGGAYGPDRRAFVEELIGETLHPACDVDGYWLVTEVLPE